MQVLSGNGRGSRSASAAEDEKGTSRTGGQDFDLRAQCPSSVPTGDVVVSECDLEEQLRKRPDSVATALDLLLGEQKVQRAPLSGLVV